MFCKKKKKGNYSKKNLVRGSVISKNLSSGIRDLQGVKNCFYILYYMVVYTIIDTLC